MADEGGSPGKGPVGTERVQVTAMIIKKLRELGKAEGLSQQEISVRSVLHRSYISAVENGRSAPRPRTLEGLVLNEP